MTEDLFLTFIDKKSLPFCDNILCKLTGYSAVQLDYTGLAVQVCCTYYLLNNNHVLYKTLFGNVAIFNFFFVCKIFFLCFEMQW